MTVNIETKTAWDCHSEYFEYYAFECPENWLDLSKEYFTQEHGAEEIGRASHHLTPRMPSHARKKQ